MDKLVDITLYQTRDGIWAARIDFGHKHRVYLGPDTYLNLMYTITERVDYEIVATRSKTAL